MTEKKYNNEDTGKRQLSSEENLGYVPKDTEI